MPTTPDAPWIEVDLDAIAGNVRTLRRRAGVPLLAVVKCDGYGHGIVQAAIAAVEGGACGVGVGGLGEAAELRARGFRGRILNLFPLTGGMTRHSSSGFPYEEHRAREDLLRQAELVLKLGIEQTIASREELVALRNTARKIRSTPKVHIKVDTGLHRLGANRDDARTILSLSNEAETLGLIELVGVFTTLAERGRAETASQVRKLKATLGKLPGVALHASSTSSLSERSAALDMVRVGLGIYGVGPESQEPDLSPALSLLAPVLSHRTVVDPEYVGYGKLHRLKKPHVISTIGIGSFDGVPRSLSARGEVLFDDGRYPIAGRVSLSHTLIDLGEKERWNEDIPVSVTLIGGRGNDRIRVEDVARAAGTSPYEILVRLSPRIERRYFKGGKLVQVRSVRDEYRRPGRNRRPRRG